MTSRKLAVQDMRASASSARAKKRVLSVCESASHTRPIGLRKKFVGVRIGLHKLGLPFDFPFNPR